MEKLRAGGHGPKRCESVEWLCERVRLGVVQLVLWPTVELGQEEPEAAGTVPLLDDLFQEIRDPFLNGQGAVLELVRALGDVDYAGEGWVVPLGGGFLAGQEAVLETVHSLVSEWYAGDDLVQPLVGGCEGGCPIVR